MTIRIELTADEELALKQQAAQQGRAVEDLAGDAVRSLVYDYLEATKPQLPRVLDETGTFHSEHWDAVMASISRGSVRAPVLPAEALRRSALYEDHD